MARWGRTSPTEGASLSEDLVEFETIEYATVFEPDPRLTIKYHVYGGHVPDGRWFRTTLQPDGTYVTVQAQGDEELDEPISIRWMYNPPLTPG
mgnify:CR=1 FL=1